MSSSSSVGTARAGLRGQAREVKQVLEAKRRGLRGPPSKEKHKCTQSSRTPSSPPAPVSCMLFSCLSVTWSERSAAAPGEVAEASLQISTSITSVEKYIDLFCYLMRVCFLYLRYLITCFMKAEKM